jgi:hypothetical protein
MDPLSVSQTNILFPEESIFWPPMEQRKLVKSKMSDRHSGLNVL